MAITQRRTSIRRAFAVSAVAIAATVLGVSSPIASAAPISKAPAISHPSLLDNKAAWAAVKEAALTGYKVSAKLAASCGAKG